MDVHDDDDNDNMMMNDEDEALPSGQERVRRPASSNEVRRMQFETARRILFGTKKISGQGQPREAWTTAGIFSVFDAQLRIPFTLGNVTLMISRGLNAMINLRRDPGPYPEYTQVVWMRLPGPVVGKDEHDRPVAYRASTTGEKSGLWIVRHWVCIGFLRRDDFIPMMPTFTDLMYLEVLKDGDTIKEVHWADVYGPTEDGRVEGNTIEIEASVINRADFQDSDDSGSAWEDSYELKKSLSAQWKQLIPAPEDGREWMSHSVEVSELVLDFADAEADQGSLETDPFEDQQAGGGHGTYRSEIAYGPKLHIEYSPVLPIAEAHRMFNVDPPEEFLANLGAASNGPCAFQRSASGRKADPTTLFCAWKHEDVAMVIYAWSYLMHVLTGPDPRPYRGDVGPFPDMKETQEPMPCLKIARATKLFGMPRVELLGHGHVPFVSAGIAMRFFTPSLAYLAARELQRDFARAAMTMSRGAFGHMISSQDREELFAMLAQMQIPLDRMEETEFLGCHVCFDKPAAFKAVKVGLQVCSQQCYAALKQGSAK